MPSAIILLLLLALSVACVIWQDRREKQRALNHLEGRSPLSDAEFGKEFFEPSKAEVAAKVRAVFAKHIPFDVSRVRPEDLVVEELRMDALDSMSTVAFIIEVEETFGVKIPDETARTMRTLRDCVDYVVASKSKTS